MPRSHRTRARAAAGAIALALTGAAPLAAQRPITLREAIALAQRQSHQARAARAAHEAARYRDRAFRARLLPQLSLSGTVPQYNRSIIPVLQPDGTTLFRSQQQTTTSLSMSLTQTLPVTGGDLFLASSLTRLDLSGAQSGRTWSSAPFTVGLRQDILRPNVAAWNRRAQDAQAESDERTYLQAMEDVAIETTDRFFAAYAARLALENAVANVAVNDTLYRLNTGRFQVGRIGENDLLQNQLAVLRSRTALEGARLDHERALAELRLALGLPADEPLEILVSDTVPAFEPDTATAVAEALRNAAAVSTVALQDVQARRRVTEARLADGIGATVLASYGFNATAPGMRLAYQNLLEARQLSVAVEVPLWQWGAHGDGVQAAEADRERVTMQSEATLAQLALDARFAALALAQARRNVALQVTADSVAEKRYQVAYNRYVIGRITIDNLYIAQAEKDQALVQFVAGLRGYWLAYYQLRRTTLYDFEAGHPIR
jgi:outer membrane protein